jgi:hypothetical protein
MHLFFPFFAVIVISVVGLAVAVTGSNAMIPFPTRRSGGFSLSCYHTYLKGWTLKTVCTNNRGTDIATSLDLSKCLGVGAGGVLVCDPGV